MEFGTLSILKPLVAVGALAVGGMGAYNFATTGCPLGSCDAPEATAMTAASTPVESSCCASKQTTEVTLVADTAETDCATKCSGEETVAELASFDSGMTAETCEAMKAACDAAGECPEAMKAACDAAGMDCHATADATLVSETTETECSGKTECETKTECEGTSDEVAQLETETTEG